MATADAIMVARGDLAPETPPEKVFFAPKWQSEQANIAAKPTHTATQMLESVIKAPTPTRAETFDVSNAALDGGDRGVLPGECADGDYPINAVTILSQICAEAAKPISDNTTLSDRKPTPKDHTVLRGRVGVASAVCSPPWTHSDLSFASRTESGSGKLARLVSSDDTITRQMNCMRGVIGHKSGSG